MIIKTVTGAGYGDEGKGLMTDYFCDKLNDHKVLNIRVNGGAQAGHTVCRLDKENKQYKHWVFRQYGSGTFAGADTYLASSFMVNFSELLKEYSKLQEIYHNTSKLYIDKECRVTLPCDIIVNRTLEDHRTKRHGSCGLGIFETFHRNQKIQPLTVKGLINKFIDKSIEDFEYYLNQLSQTCIKTRINEIRIVDNIEIDDIEFDKMKEQARKMNKEFIDNLVDIIKCKDIEFSESLDKLLKEKGYNAVVFECSQGLELDQYNERNFPHLTPSNTGLLDIITAIKESKTLQNGEIENCFVTRSYKTKHGAGEFVEEDIAIQNQFNLYDRTNHRNQYQGQLKYGRLNFGRLKRLILEQVDKQASLIENTVLKQSTTLAITHLDQTNECLILNTGIENYNDIEFKMFDKVYKSFGEKAVDILD